MIYKKYQHVIKYSDSELETQGLLKGKVHLFHKIDGTNSCVFLDENKNLCFGSRRREITPTEDNQGFASSFYMNPAFALSIRNMLLELPKNSIIYGEWLVPVTIKTYEKDAWRKFYVFDVVVYPDNISPDDLADDVVSRRHEMYLPYEVYSLMCEKFGVNYIPVIDVLDDPTMDDVRGRLDKTTFLNDGRVGEGIVIKNYGYKNPYGRKTWGKILCSEFYDKKHKLRTENHESKDENPTEHKIITKYLTSEFIQKEISKFEEINGKFEMKRFPVLSSYLFNEFLVDNLNLILEDFRMPTINFLVLKKMVEKEVKNILLN